MKIIKTGIKQTNPYNPFFKIESLVRDMTEMISFERTSRYLNTHDDVHYSVSTGEIRLGRMVTFKELVEIYKKLNLYYPIIAILTKSLEGDLLKQANRFYYKTDKSLMSCYSVCFPANAREKRLDPNKNKVKYIINRNVERYFNIFTRPKRLLHEGNRCFFKEIDDLRITKELAGVLKKKIDNGFIECSKMLKKQENSRKLTELLRHQVFHSYSKNLYDIVDLLEKISKEHNIRLDFDIESIVGRSMDMVCNSLRFILLRKWIDLPKPRKRRQGKKPKTHKKKLRSKKSEMSRNRTVKK